MKAAIYVRVSTQEQAEEGYSIKAQIERLNAYATSQDWTVVKTYIDDGQSAKDMNRTDLSRMIEDMREDMFDCVLVYKLDRLTRSVLDLYKMLEIFEKHNVKFKSATEVYDTTNAMGRLFITLVAALAQWERENLGERVRMGMTQKAKEGKWTVSIPPFGFDRNKDQLIINEQEATVVKEIFHMYLSGKYGAGKIAKILNQRGTLTKANANWNDSTIKYILKNIIYIGTMRYNYRVNIEHYFEVENVVPAIIEEEEFDEVQRILEMRSTQHPRRATSPYIFTSNLRCSRCGGIMYGKQGGKPKYINYSYLCRNKRFGTCNQGTISQNYLEVQFLKLISEWEYTQLINDELQDAQISKHDSKEKLKQLKKELVEIDERRVQWQYAWVNKMITDQDLKKRNVEENEAEKRTKDQIKSISMGIDTDTKQIALTEALKDIKENWIALEVFEKKRLVEMLVKEMQVDKISNSRNPESVAITNIVFL